MGVDFLKVRAAVRISCGVKNRSGCLLRHTSSFAIHSLTSSTLLSLCVSHCSDQVVACIAKIPMGCVVCSPISLDTIAGSFLRSSFANLCRKPDPFSMLSEFV